MSALIPMYRIENILARQKFHNAETRSGDTERQSGDAEMQFRRPEPQSSQAERTLYEGKRALLPLVFRFGLLSRLPLHV